MKNIKDNIGNSITPEEGSNIEELNSIDFKATSKRITFVKSFDFYCKHQTAKCLFLGTIPSRNSINYGCKYKDVAGHSYYVAPGNSFWLLLDAVINNIKISDESNNEDKALKRIRLLEKITSDYPIALYDTVKYAIRVGSRDSDIIYKSLVEKVELEQKINDFEIKTVFVTSREAQDNLKKIFGAKFDKNNMKLKLDNNEINVIYLQSPSKNNPNDISEKLKIWKDNNIKDLLTQ